MTLFLIYIKMLDLAGGGAMQLAYTFLKDVHFKNIFSN